MKSQITVYITNKKSISKIKINLKTKWNKEFKKT